MNKYKYFIVFLFLITSICIAKTNAEVSFIQSANKVYSQENYKAAIQIYKDNNFQKYNSAKLFFNMANFYYRDKEYAQAYFYYLKSYTLDPFDHDVLYNLKYVQKKINNKNSLISEDLADINNLSNFKYDFIFNYSYQLLMLSFFILICIFIFNLFYHNKNMKWIKMIFIGFSICFSIILVFEHKNASKILAVVMDQKIDMYSGPSFNNIILYKLPYGQIVKIISRQKEWAKIEFTGSKRLGWVKLKSLYFIFEK